MQATIKPVDVERDECGQWVHPALDELLGGREGLPLDEWKQWRADNGMETSTWQLSEHDDHPLAHIYYESEAPDISEWALVPPDGPGWFLLSVHCEEDGPTQIWARPIAPSSNTPKES